MLIPVYKTSVNWGLVLISGTIASQITVWRGMVYCVCIGDKFQGNRGAGCYPIIYVHYIPHALFYCWLMYLQKPMQKGGLSNKFPYRGILVKKSYGLISKPMSAEPMATLSVLMWKASNLFSQEPKRNLLCVWLT